MYIYRVRIDKHSNSLEKHVKNPAFLSSHRQTFELDDFSSPNSQTNELI